MNNRIKISLILLLLWISISITSFSAELESNYNKINQLLDHMVLPSEPGIQYIAVNEKDVVFSRSIGLADIKNKIPLSLGHTMTAFSMTKTLTAIAVLQLAEQGKINLNSKAINYIEHPYDSGITIRQLLSHTSGIPDPIPLRWVHLAGTQNDFNEKKALSEVLVENSQTCFLPGEEYVYSNIAYWLLGNIIEKVSGQDYRDYVNENIFDVLSLSRNEIGFEINNEDNHAKGYLKKYSFMNLAKYFLLDEDIWGNYEGSWLHINNIYLNGPAFGGVIGTASAFARILQDLLNNNSVLLGKAVKQQLYSQQTVKSGQPIDMTLGWHIGELDGKKYYYKEGGGAGMHSEMRIYPDRDLASVIMVNRTSFDTRKNLSELDKHLIGK